MTVVLDAGGFVALERLDRQVMAVLKRELQDDRVPLTHGGVVGQVWRGGAGHQVPLARALAGIEVRPLDDALGRVAGVLLGAAGQADVVDAAIVLLAQDGDEVLTSDVDDLALLAESAGRHIDLIAV